MRQKSGPEKGPAEDAIRDIRRATRRHFSAEEKIRVVLEGARGCPLRQARIGYQRAALALKSMRSRVPEPMKIASFNINIKRRLSNLLNWLREAEPDIPRAHGPRREVPAEAIRRAGNHAAWRGETRWHGVAILARRAPVVTRGLASRRPPMVSAATSRRRLMACLSPRRSEWKPSARSQIRLKLAWLKRLTGHAAELYATGAPVVLAGDLNVVPTGIHIHPTKSWDRDALLQPQSRAACSPGKRRNSTTAGITPNQSPNPASRKNVRELLSRMDIARAHAQGFVLGL
jgi:exonuclease III